MENDFSINPYQQPVCVIIDGDLLTSGRYFFMVFQIVQRIGLWKQFVFICMTNYMNTN